MREARLAARIEIAARKEIAHRYYSHAHGAVFVGPLRPGYIVRHPQVKAHRDYFSLCANSPGLSRQPPRQGLWYGTASATPAARGYALPTPNRARRSGKDRNKTIQPCERMRAVGNQQLDLGIALLHQGRACWASVTTTWRPSRRRTFFTRRLMEGSSTITITPGCWVGAMNRIGARQ